MMKSLSQALTENGLLIEEAMKKYLDVGDRPYNELLDSMRYSAYAGGKRVRPFLTLEVCKMLGGSVEAALPFACAIEMVHTYSLIHDDLPCMDDDVERRGKPTNHVVFGETTALLSGDALLTYAFAVAASNPHVFNYTAVNAVKLLADNAGFDGMIGGQMLDLEGEKRPLDSDEHLLMNRLKTGCLIRTACLLGCIAADYGEDTAEYAAVKTYAENIGLAFQIEDDLLDMGSEDNKTTFLTFMSPDEAKEKINELTDGAINAISAYNGSAVLIEFARYLSSRTV